MERHNGWTTIDESRMLLDAGLDPSTADMRYEYDYRDDSKEREWSLVPGRSISVVKRLFSFRTGHVVPCWSLGALLDLFPTANESRTDEYVNIQRRMKSKYYPESWHLYFIGPVDRKLHFVDEAVFIEGVVKMMVLCIEHGLVKKGGE